MTNPWFKFYPTDWKADNQLKLCSAGARGLWIEMLCICHEATPYGHFLINGSAPTETELSVLTGIPMEQITALMGELSSRSIFSRTSKGVIYSRKMVNDEKKSKDGKKYIKKRWDKGTEIKGEIPEPNRSPNSPPKTQKPEARLIYTGKVIKLKEETFYSLLSKTGMDEQSFALFLDEEDKYYSTIPAEQKAKWFFFLKAKINKMETA